MPSCDGFTWMGYSCASSGSLQQRHQQQAERQCEQEAGQQAWNDSGLHPLGIGDVVDTYRNLYATLCSYDNLRMAFINARKRKTLKEYVIEFEGDLDNNLKQLKQELETFTYVPRPLTTFIVRDPKTRKISASHFRDRVVHHALCNIMEPILSRNFIYDSFANQKGKGTHQAIFRFEQFLRKVKAQKSELHGGGAA